MLLELDETAGTPPTIAVRRKQNWRLDLAGQHGGGGPGGVGILPASLQSAGGIGGLLSVYDTVGRHFAASYWTCCGSSSRSELIVFPDSVR